MNNEQSGGRQRSLFCIQYSVFYIHYSLFIIFYRLHLYQLIIAALTCHELLVGAPLDNTALLKDNDKVGMTDGGEAMGHDKSRAAREEGLECLLHKAFAFGIESAGGLVEDEEAGVGEDGAGNREALPLSAAEEGAAVANLSIVALGLLHDEIVGLGYLRSTDYLLHRGLGHSEGDIVADGVVEEVGLLRDNSDMMAQRRERIGRERLAVDEDLAAAAVVETHEEVGQGALARPRAANKGHHGASGNRKADIVQHLDIGSVAEVDILKLDALFEPFENKALLDRLQSGVRRAELIVENGLETIDAGTAFLDLRDGGGELFRRRNHEHEHHDVRHKELGGELPLAPQHHAGAEEQDAYNDTVAQEVAHRRREVDAAQDAGAKAGILAVGLLETTVGELDGCIGLDNFEAHDGLLHERGEERPHLLKSPRAATQPVGDARDDQDDDGQHAEDEEGEARADIEQHDEIENHADDGRDQLLHRAHDALVIFFDIAAEAGKKVAFAIVGEIG